MRKSPDDDWPDIAGSLARWFLLAVFFYLWLTGCTVTLTNSTHVAAEVLGHKRELVNGSVTLRLELPRETTKEEATP